MAGRALKEDNRGTETQEDALVHVALYNPEIHPNTGNIARLCAANRLPLHLVGALGFRIDDRSIKRAGLDYWPRVDLRREETLEQLRDVLPDAGFYYFSARARRLFTEARFDRGDCLVFGPESAGLPPELILTHTENALRIPLLTDNVRSLNLATSVGIAVYEALRQILGPRFQYPDRCK